MSSTHRTLYQGIRDIVTRSFQPISRDRQKEEFDMEEYHREHSGEEDFLVVSPLPFPRVPEPFSPSNLRRVVAFDTPPATPPPPPSRISRLPLNPPATDKRKSNLHHQSHNGYMPNSKQLPPLPSFATTASQQDNKLTHPLPPAPSVTPRPGPVRAVITTIAAGVPLTSRSQSDVAAQVASLYSPSSPFSAKIPQIYTNTCISTRHKAIDPLDPSFDRNMPIRQRMDLFLTHAGPLCVNLAREALASSSSGISNPSEEVGLLVVVTSTGFVAPGVDVAIVQGLGLSRSVKRVVINFMGYAAAMNGLRTAADYAIAQEYTSFYSGETPKKALLVCVELSSVNGVFSESINDVIISSLFGGGCAAMVIGATTVSNSAALQPGQIILGPSFSQLIDETTEDKAGIDTSTGIIIGVNSNGITCDLSPKLPSYIRSAVGPVLESVLSENNFKKDDIKHWAIHPGGPKIIEESLASLGLNNEVAATSWDILSKYGNMLSVSLPFVLKSMVEGRLQERDGEAEKKWDRTSKGAAFSFGPGITIEGVLFDIVGN